MLYINSIHEACKSKSTPEEKDKEIEKKVKETEPKPVKEGLTYMEAGYQICIENQRNWNNIMMAVGLDELSYLDKEGKAKVYTESGIADFFGKIAAVVQSIWAKIKGLWRKFTTAIAAMFKGDEDFINKYGSVMEDGASMASTKLSGEDHSGYKFDGSLDYSGAGSMLTSYIGSISSRLHEAGFLTEADNSSEKPSADDNFVKTFRQKICSGCSGSSDTFSDDCLEKLRGAKVKNIFTDFNFAQIKQEILEAKANNEANSKAYKETESVITAELKKIESLKSSSNSGDLNNKVSGVMKTISDSNSALTIANSATISALKAKYAQAKTIAKRWVVIGKGKNDKEPNKVAADESAITPGNLLENLGII